MVLSANLMETGKTVGGYVAGASKQHPVKMWALRYLLRKDKHASTIHSEVTDYDTYWIYFVQPEMQAQHEDGQTEDAPDPRKMIVEPGSGKNLKARRVRQLDENKQPAKKLTSSMIDGATFEIRHFYRDIETAYTSPTTAAFIRLTGIYKLVWAWQKVVQARASRKTKFLRERKTVLETIIKLDDEKAPSIDVLSVAREIRGPDFHLIEQTRKRHYLRHLQRIIDSLSFTEEIHYDQGRRTYKTTGKCMASLLEWERELRRHRAGVVRESVVIFLTLVIALGTAVQAYHLVSGAG